LRFPDLLEDVLKIKQDIKTLQSRIDMVERQLREVVNRGTASRK
jgi:hypothetical protein